jgi:hypothetical protein
MPSTVLICASCEVICALSMGLSGSWFFNCVVSSLRKRFCASVMALADDAVSVDLLASISAWVVVALLPMVLTAMILLPKIYWPIARVFCTSDLAALRTSTLFW